ncbi:unnamed protein product [Caenorhabditis sp. 36 PRJEB53466]|nr:unnamed protein product [Caenorhabditis sp. 36 PRJEB53466]
MKFPNALNVLTVASAEVYDMSTNKWMLATTCLISLMLSSSIVISSVFSVALFRTLRKKRSLISARNYISHHIAVTSLMAQAAIPFAVIIIPIGTIVCSIIKVFPNAQNISNAMMAIYSFHSTLSTAVMIVSTPQYRKLIGRGFRSSTALATPQLTKIAPLQPINNYRSKKLSEPQL